MTARRYQAALETLILIGGVVIVAAASYFVMKGFVATGGESTQATMNRGSDVAKEDLLNLGVQSISLPYAQWYAVGSRIKTNFTLENQGSSPLSTSVSLKKAGFSDNGADTDQFEIGFLSIISGDYEELDDSASNSTDFVFETPVIPVGESLEIILHYNNSSPYTPITGFEYVIEEPSVVLREETVESIVKTDFEPPVFEQTFIQTPSAGAGEKIVFSVPVSENSSVSEASFSVSVNSESGSFSTSVFDADGLYHLVSGAPGGSLTLKGVYDSSSSSLVFEFTPMVSGDYGFSYIVVDEWGNTGSGASVLTVESDGTYEGSPAPAISGFSTTPQNPSSTSAVTFSATATDPDGVAWCALTVSKKNTVFLDNESMSGVGDVYSHEESEGFLTGVYEAQVACRDSAGFESNASISFTVTSPPVDGWAEFCFNPENTCVPSYGSSASIGGATWPQATGGAVWGGPAVADVDANPGNGLEILVGAHDQNAHAWHSDGSVSTGWPKATGGNIYLSPAIVDFDGNPGNGLEVLSGSYDGNLYVWQSDGSALSGWPVSAGGSVYGCPAVADLDGNASNGLEVVVGSFSNNVYAWHSDGSIVTGWPQATGDDVLSSPTIVDLDGDFELEVLCGSKDNKVHAWHRNGSVVAGWPQTTGAEVRASPSVADLDGNESNGLEVVFGSLDNNVYAFHADGTSVPGWPKSTGNWVYSTSAIADLDLNGNLEVVAVSYDANVYAWHSNGTVVSGWPQSASAISYPGPAVGDLDGNTGNGLEVAVATGNGYLRVWHADGSVASGWPQSGGGVHMDVTPVMVDLDANLGNGLELVAGSSDFNVYVWHSDGSVFS